MLSNTTRQFYFTGDYYSYTHMTDPNNPDSTVNIYTTIPTQVKLSLTTNIFGQLKIDSEVKMQRGGLLKNIVDKHGEQIYTDGVWEILQTAPNLNGLGEKDGYQYVAGIISGDI